MSSRTALYLVMGLLIAGLLSACGEWGQLVESATATQTPVEANLQTTAIDDGMSAPEAATPVSNEEAVPLPDTRPPTAEISQVTSGETIPEGTTLVPFYEGVTSVAIQSFHLTQYEAEFMNGRVEVRMRHAGDTAYQNYMRLSPEDLPMNLDTDIWVSQEGFHVNLGNASAFHVKIFMGGTEQFSVKPVTEGLSADFEVRVNYNMDYHFDMGVYENGELVGGSAGTTCPEGCQISVDTSRLGGTYIDQLNGYFFFATGWNDTPQFVFPLGWAPRK